MTVTPKPEPLEPLEPLELTSKWYTDTARYQDGNGLRWGVIRADYLERCSPEEHLAMTSQSPFDEKGSVRNKPRNSPLLNRELPKKKAASANSAGSPTGVRTDAKKEQDVADLYVRQCSSPAAIGIALGLHRATVRRILLEKTNYDPTEWIGAGRRTAPAYKDGAHADV